MDRNYENLLDKITGKLDEIKVDRKISSNDNADATVFPFWVAELLEMDPTDAEIGVVGNEHGIDILHIDTEKKRIDIIQVKWSDKLSTTGHILDKNVTAKLLVAPDLLYDPTVTGNQVFDRRKETFRDEINAGGYNIHLKLVTAGDITDGDEIEHNVFRKSFPKDFTKGKGNANTIVSLKCYSRAKIHDLAYHPITPSISFDCEEIMEYQNGQRKDLFAIIKGVELNNKLPEDYHISLFEYNPRFYLGDDENDKSNINFGIKSTAKDDEDSENFLEYNNGITSVCVESTVKNKTIIVENLKIVNGCQTVIALGEVGAKVKDNVKILCKFYEIPDDTVEHICNTWMRLSEE